MKKIVLIVVYALTGLCAQAQGIKFSEGLNWSELKMKAFRERKYIFIDAFTTWCGPCKLMDKEVYTATKVGDYFNSKFISVKIQMDRTKTDSKSIQEWYSVARELGKNYHVDAYPTMLFLSPEGELVAKTVGAKGADDLISEADKALDPAKQYSRLMKLYDTGKREPAFVREIARAARENGEEEKAYTIANEYLNVLSDQQLREEANVQFAADFLRTSKDRGFNLFYKDWNYASKYIDNKDFGPGIVGLIIFNEEVQPFLEIKGSKPDYQRIKLNLQQYGAMGNEVWRRYHFYIFNRYELMPFLRTYPEWGEIIKLISHENLDKDEEAAYRSVISYYTHGIISGNAIKNLINTVELFQKKYPYSNMEAVLNESAYLIFNSSSAKSDLKMALKWAGQLLKKDSIPAYLDTYAGILYKLGRDREAIALQSRAVEKSHGQREFSVTLDKMKAGKKLGWDFGKQVNLNGKKIDFTGKWALDSLNGEFSGMSATQAAPLHLFLTQSSDKIDIQREFFGMSSKVESVTFDGKPVLVEVPSIRIQRKLVWSEDGSILTVFSVYTDTSVEGQPFEYEREETFTLMDKGKSLLCSRITIFPGKVDNVKALYRRK